jgi:xylose isomerase
MRTYLILAEKARRFADDPEIADALADARATQLAEPTSPGGLGADALAAIREGAGGVDEDALAGVGYGHERLDQLVTELLLGVR